MSIFGLATHLVDPCHPGHATLFHSKIFWGSLSFPSMRSLRTEASSCAQPRAAGSRGGTGPVEGWRRVTTDFTPLREGQPGRAGGATRVATVISRSVFRVSKGKFRVDSPATQDEGGPPFWFTGLFRRGDGTKYEFRFRKPADGTTQFPDEWRCLPGEASGKTPRSLGPFSPPSGALIESKKPVLHPIKNNRRPCLRPLPYPIGLRRNRPRRPADRSS